MLAPPALSASARPAMQAGEEEPAARRPVVVLPGMFASFNLACLTGLGSCDQDSRWGWTPVEAEAVYAALIGQLEAAGYTEENGYLAVFFYDWRRPVAENVPRLRATIQALREVSGAGQVDLVGHSMGGLLARAYVQDPSYAGDVAHLVTMGSPHYGATKVYPYWEAAYFHEVDPLEEIALALVLTYYMLREADPIPVRVLRSVVPSGQDLLPVWDYLYDSETGALKPELEMAHRNGWLPELNAGLDLLFERLGEGGVATFAATYRDTGERFYVHPFDRWSRLPFEWFNWDDGEPEWARQAEFYRAEGDGTVLASSALLPPPASRLVFGGLDGTGIGHHELAGDPQVLAAVFEFLGIPPVAVEAPPEAGAALVMYLDGPVEAQVVDPQGQALAATQSGGEMQVLSLPQRTFRYVILPDPAGGTYRVALTGQGAGLFAAGLLDRSQPPGADIPDLMAEWDALRSQVEPGFTVSLAVSYAPESEATSLHAETPLVAAPLYAGAQAVAGWALPGAQVEIRDQADGRLLGAGAADDGGRFSIALEERLAMHQRLYPAAGGVEGPAVEALPRYVYLPGVSR